MRFISALALALLCGTAHAEYLTVSPAGGGTAAGITINTTTITGGTTNQLLFDNAGTIGEITKGNSCVYLTNGSGVPSCSTTLPTGIVISSASITSGLGYTPCDPANNSCFNSASTFRTNLGLGSIATQAASAVAITGGTVAGLTGFGIRDTSAAFDVTIAAVSSAALTAGRTLTLDMKNVAHIVTLGTTASTGSGIIFPNTATDTVAMLGVANAFTAAQLMPAGTGSAPGLAIGQVNTGFHTATYPTIGLSITPDPNGAGQVAFDSQYGVTFGTGWFIGFKTVALAAVGAPNSTLSQASSGVLQIGTTAANALGSLNLANLTGTGTIIIGTGDAASSTGGALQVTGGGSVAKRFWLPAITTSSGLQTAVLCQSSGGEVIADSVACLASSEDLKEIVGDSMIGLKAILAMRPIDYRYALTGNPRFDNAPNQRAVHPGLGAKAVAAIDPHLVAYDPDGKVRTIRQDSLSAVIVKAIQEQQAQIDQLRASK